MRIPRRKEGGFTVIELLVVVAIIAFLIALVGVVAVRARQKARVSRTKALIKRVQVALDAYKTIHREYPAGVLIHTDTWPSPYNIAGVDFDHRVVTQRDPGGFSFNDSEKDPADPNYLIDAWGRRVRYRKVSPGRILVWSIGEDGRDQIGADTGKARERGSNIPVDASGNVVASGSRYSDDISNVEVDY